MALFQRLDMPSTSWPSSGEVTDLDQDLALLTAVIGNLPRRLPLNCLEGVKVLINVLRSNECLEV